MGSIPVYAKYAMSFMDLSRLNQAKYILDWDCQLHPELFEWRVRTLSGMLLDVSFMIYWLGQVSACLNLESPLKCVEGALNKLKGLGDMEITDVFTV